MTKRKQALNPLTTLLNDPGIRRAYHQERTYFAVPDLIQILTQTRFPIEYWEDLKKREPGLASIEERMEIGSEIVACVDTTGISRLIQSIASPQAEKLKRWLAESAAQRFEELENPELGILRLRKSYEDKGYSSRWIDKRLRAISARQELTSEWGRRGADQGEQYRALTNAVMEGVFGMDVERLRRYKNLQRPTQNLRDYMNDLELVLTSLAETSAVALHRNRASHGLEELLDDAREAGRIAGVARTQIEQGSARKPRHKDEPAWASERL